MITKAFHLSTGSIVNQSDQHENLSEIRDLRDKLVELSKENSTLKMQNAYLQERIAFFKQLHDPAEFTSRPPDETI
jgi:regulator of replication initiation timing